MILAIFVAEFLVKGIRIWSFRGEQFQPMRFFKFVAHTGEALCGETGFCCGFWTPNWCPQKSLFFHSLKEQKVGKTSEI